MQRYLGKLSIVTLLAVIVMSTISGASARPAYSSAGAPTVVSYQGRVSLDGSSYTGTGYFKFAIVDASGAVSYWSNDATSTAGSEPTASVPLTVTAGLFHVLLGDSQTGMTMPLTAAVFSTNTDTYLRVWFSDDDASFTLLTPDQKIAAVPYALQAESAKAADDADTLDGVDSTGFQLRVTGACQPGATIQTINSDGTVVCESRDDFPIYGSIDHGVVGLGMDVAIGPDGLPLILSYSADQIKATACKDAACTQQTTSISIPTTATPGVAASFSGGISMAFGSDGLAAFTIWDSNGGHSYYGRCDDRQCTSVTLQTLNGPLLVPNQMTMDMLITTDGNALIAAFENGANLLHIVHCNDLACSTPLYRQQIMNVKSGPSLTMTSDGYPLVAYVDNTSPFYLYTSSCMDPYCINPLFTSGHASAANALLPVAATAIDGTAMIAYLDTVNFNVSYAKCGSTACGSVNVNLIQNIGFPFFHSRPSIVRGSDGLPLIGFYDDTSPAGFYVARCSDSSCIMAGQSTYQIHQGSNDGWWSALTVGVDGMPLLVYDIAATTTFEITHCSNIFCVPFWREW